MKLLKKIIAVAQKMTLMSLFDFTFYLLVFLILVCNSCTKNTENIQLKKGLVISESVTISQDTFLIYANRSPNISAIVIQGKNIVVDFQGAVLKGSNNKTHRNEFDGIGLLVKGENIEIKNLEIKNYQYAIVAKGVKNLKITDSKFNFNNRIFLNKKGERRQLEGFSSPQSSDWKAAAIILNTCSNVIFKNNIVTQNRHGLFIQKCKNTTIYNNKITHNAGFGIIMNLSSDSKIMHNYLDWNILNNSFLKKKYVPTTDAGGIRIINDSTNNIIAYNSISHSSNNNFGNSLVYKNDFFPFSMDSVYQNKNTLKVTPLDNGENVNSEKYPFRGKNFILLNEWGPYNFQYPTIWLREINDDKYTFAIFGPEGNWKIVNGNGFVQTSRQSGSTPATIVATKAKNSTEALSLDLEFIGVEFTNQLGKKNPRGKTYKFSFKNKVD